jgi:hypothetical protein
VLESSPNDKLEKFFDGLGGHLVEQNESKENSAVNTAISDDQDDKYITICRALYTYKLNTLY